MVEAGIFMDRVVASVDNGLKIAAAARILREEADNGQHEKIAAMLRMCADALAIHPEPRVLCQRNEDRLNAQFEGDNHETWPAGLRAVHVALAAEAFGRAARVLR